MPASFAIFLCENGIIKNNFKVVLTEIVYEATNPYSRKKSHNISLPQMDYVMLKKYIETNHVNIGLQPTGLW